MGVEEQAVSFQTTKSLHEGNLLTKRFAFRNEIPSLLTSLTLASSSSQPYFVARIFLLLIAVIESEIIGIAANRSLRGTRLLDFSVPKVACTSVPMLQPKVESGIHQDLQDLPLLGMIIRGMRCDVRGEIEQVFRMRILSALHFHHGVDVELKVGSDGQGFG